MNNNFIIRNATTGDIQEVKALLERYHAKNLDDQQKKNGFVTTDMTISQLSQLCNEENGVAIAIDEDTGKIVAILLGASWSFLKPWPMFEYMAKILPNYSFRNSQLNSSESYQYGPICIAEEYRGLGIGEKLLDHQRKEFSKNYENVVTFVNVKNSRSYAFHKRNKFEDIGRFEFNGNHYHLMAIGT
ncbi:GNAT family N-acetyltransferase [Rosenbergiella metrosideri]|uniref:GNAT family N-acetyltransferase n=1 Tax=Rosenbergiella metrosideri TaxID=2921185 RepID=UPI001F503CCC|nr:GNAT family N-acetyltransferase [Rosenbergiella metrosideri]